MTPSRRLRICHVAYTFYENDNRVIRYAEALAERGHDVSVIALRRPSQEWVGALRGVRLYRVQRRSVTEKHAFAYLAKLICFLVQSAALLSLLSIRRRYDIVHVHNVPDFLVFAALFPKLTGARVILDIHDIVPELYAGKFATAEQSSTFRALLVAERLSCAFADHVIVANHLWHEKLIRRTVPREKCTTILNYPDLRLFKPRADAASRRDDRFVILYPGTLNQHQGLDVAIRAFALAAPRMPRAEFHIYGEGPARPALAELIEQMGLADRVKLMPRVPLDQIAGIMASADLGVVPKRADGFGNEAFSTKILEFMACGVPVVVSRTQIDAHYFDDSVVRFFPSAQEDDLALALVDEYEHLSAQQARITAAREFASRNSWQVRVTDYQRVIDTLSLDRQLSEAGASL